MKHLISFNESFRFESIKSDVEEIFYSEVEDLGFKIYSGGAWRGSWFFLFRRKSRLPLLW